jgi:Zn-dependent protease with chaperone function
MHLSIILLSICAVFAVRFYWRRSSASWLNRWQWAIGSLVFPPLLLGATALAVLLMGTEGYMLGLPVGWMGYLLALGFLSYGGVRLVMMAAGGWRSLQTVKAGDSLKERLRQRFSVHNTDGYVLDSPTLFAAQVGFWNSQLVVSQGLLDTLNDEQMAAVLTHESAHFYYRDTFWFFWLGWLRQITAWLPQSQALWQELLLLRELRADRWAAQTVDPLLLAESLLLVVREASTQPSFNCAAFDTADRLEERIEALLNDAQLPVSGRSIALAWLFIAISPLLTLLLHS